MKKSLKIMAFIRKILKFIFILIFVILVWYNIININNKNEYVEILGYKIFVVQDHQKQEGINKDTIIISKTTNEKLKQNDLVVIRISGTTYFHRIVETIGNQKYITKGDGNYQQDKTIFENEQIEGKVIKQIPALGKILNVVKTKFFSIIILGVLIMIFKYNKHLYVRRNKRRLKQKSNNNVTI